MPALSALPTTTPAPFVSVASRSAATRTTPLIFASRLPIAVREVRQTQPKPAPKSPEGAQALYLGIVPVTRSGMYRAPVGVHAVVRHFGLSNVASVARTVSIWIGAVMVVPRVVLQPGDGIGMDISMWVIRPDEAIDLQASGDGVFAAIYGIEEVA